MDAGNFTAFSAVQHLTDQAPTPLFNPHQAPTPGGPYTGQEAQFSTEPETPVLQDVFSLRQIGNGEPSSTEVIAPAAKPKKQKKQKTQKTLTPQEQAAKENTEKFHTQMRTAADSLKFLKSLPLDEGSMADSIKTVAKTALAGFYDDLPALQKDVGRLAKFYTWIRRRNNKKEFVESQENFALLCETFGLEKPPNTTSTEEAATEAFAESLERAVGEIREAFQTSITAHLPRPSKKSKTNQGDAVASMLNDVDIERILLGSLYAADKTSALPRMAQAMYFTLGNYAQARRMAFSQGEYASEKVLEQNAAAGEGAVEVVVNATDN